MKYPTLEIYKKYLETEKKDWNEQIRRPIKKNILLSMISTHKKLGVDPSPLVKEILDKNGDIYFWSDQHFFHHNIIKYANRPFQSISEMNQKMVNNYYEKVKENDLVFFCGDVAFGEIELTRNLLKGSPGKKVLIMGNHDFDKNKCIFRNYHLFDAICMGFDFTCNLNSKNVDFIVTHYPIDEKFLPEGVVNIHGHIHQYKLGVKHFNVSVEHTNYQPLSLNEIISSIDL